MFKDKAYWQAYNQKRQAYLTLKKRESRAKLKALSTTTPKKVVDYQVVDTLAVVDQRKVVDHKPQLVVDHPILTQLIQAWQTQTNYSCPPTCLYSYCNNCWFFAENELIDYKGVSM